MKKMDIEQVIREYLLNVLHMSLATVKDNRPWVCEVHFAYDDELNVYFRSLPARRHSQEIAENAHVAGNIVRQHKLGEYPLGVYFEGTAQVLPAGDEQGRVATLLRERLQIPVDILEEAKDPEGAQFYKITVKNWYVFGKLEGKSGQKYKLEWNL